MDNSPFSGLFGDPSKVAALSMLAHVFDPYGKDNTQTLVELANSKTQQNAMLLALKQAGLDDNTAKALASNPAAAKMMLDQRQLQRQQADDSAVPSFMQTPQPGQPQGQPSATSIPPATPQASSLAGYMDTTKRQESGGNPNATNPNSSATGLYQFTNGTWDSVAKAHPELGLTPDGRLNADQQQKAMQAFTADNAKTLDGAGFTANPQTLYLAHFLGPQGAVKFLSGARDNPNAQITELVSPQAIAANKTVFMNQDGSMKTPEQFFTGLTSRFKGAPVAAQDDGESAAPEQRTPLPQSARGSKGTVEQVEAYLRDHPNMSKENRAYWRDYQKKLLDESSPTSETKNYRDYYNQQVAMGKNPLPILQWQQAAKDTLKDPNSVHVLGKGGELYKTDAEGNVTIVHKNEDPISADAASIDDKTATLLANRVLQGDTKALVGLGRGAQGAANILKIHKFASDIADENGIDAKAILNNTAQQAGLVSASRALGTKETHFGVAEKAMEESLPLAQAASDNVPRTEWLTVNKLIQAGQTEHANPKLKRFLIATDTAAKDYARTINPTGALRESDIEYARKILSTADGPEAYTAALDQLRMEAGVMHRAIQRQKSELRGGDKPKIPDSGMAPGNTGWKVISP